MAEKTGRKAKKTALGRRDKQDSFLSKERYDYELAHSIKDQEKYKERKERDLKIFVQSGGLGEKFLKGMKIFLIIFGLIVVGLGTYIFMYKKEMSYTYVMIILVFMLVVAVVYYRKLVDKRLL